MPKLAVAESLVCFKLDPIRPCARWSSITTAGTERMKRGCAGDVLRGLPSRTTHNHFNQNSIRYAQTLYCYILHIDNGCNSHPDVDGHQLRS